MIDYLDRRVKAILPNSFYYIGKVINQNDNSITILDKERKEVLLNVNLLVSLEVLD